MKKIIFLVIIICFACTLQLLAEEKKQSVLKELLVPAKISKLDWILLNIQVSAFSEKISWDNFGLVDSIELYSIERGPKIGMTFLVNKNNYLILKNNFLRKTLLDVVEGAFRIVKITLPEINLEKDIYANFITSENRKVIAMSYT
jgi:hypothetical protein